MGALPPPASPLEEEEVSPSGRWLATKQLFDFDKIEALVVCEVGMADYFVDVYGRGMMGIWVTSKIHHGTFLKDHL